MDTVDMYETTTGTWSKSGTNGPTPSSRCGHTALLSSDGINVIVFGGTILNAGITNELWTLNTSTFQWASPPFTGYPPSAGLYGANGKA
ncbi:hypothetical protein BC936DRAFT_141654 [Jimgerdemannia flammicorona]|uniref:Galactose oxidase n=1 Tax=Jimgerdemannia flammicorona TaxID=994334 RepID=A0A433A1V7_9FUNG|nr:hypothetical protein BC936DRAFT_141654 [Jimgerdemannia flammicorona]